MQFDIENTIQDNIRLKKSLQMSRFSYDKLQKQHKQLKFLYEQSCQRNKQLKDDFCQLQRKYQQSFTQNVKDNNTLISQIEELKKVIQDKQRELQHIQIKLIPNLDQDMLRVKLITEMEGPYQETVDRKDKEIEKLKQKVSELERKCQISYLSSKSKISELKKEREEIKAKYVEETEKLMQQLNIALSRNEAKAIQFSIMKNQKKQIDQLKVTLQFLSKNQERYQDEIKNLKDQRNHLLQKLMHLSNKQALLISGRNNQQQISRLKDRQNQLITQLNRLKVQNQKHLRIKLKLQQQKNKIQTQLQKQLTQHQNKFSLQKSQLNNEIFQLKEQIKRLKLFNQTDKEKIYFEVTRLEKEVYEKTKEIQRLVMENSRISQKDVGCWDGWKRGEINQGEGKENQRTIHNVLRKSVKINTESQQGYNELKRQNQKLRKKLQEANAKIVQLLKQKMKTNYAGNISPPQRDRTQSAIQNKPCGVFLSYEDCSFKPIVQPTLYTYMDNDKRRRS